MEKIIFYKGEETGIVTEKSDFGQSLFTEQYVKSHHLFTRIFNYNTEQSNIIAFCGDRGEGKTSCMKSFCNLLEDKEQLKLFESQKKIDDKLNCCEISIFETIDPAFFDQKHNLIELILGKMYGNMKKRCREMDETAIERDKMQRDTLLSLFQRAKVSLGHLEKKRDEMFDPLEELDILAAGISLKTCLANLFEQYLKYIGKKKLVIPIDDLDLNITGGYEMVEQIRKYLDNKFCILLIAVKTEQLVDLIQSSISKNFSTRDEIPILHFYNMAVKYVTKLIPYSNRIYMPHVSELSHKKLEMRDSRDVKEVHGEQKTVKEYITQEIFRKTRYLFYNAIGSPSPIVPDNLRNLRLLIGLLEAMPDFESNEKHAANKETFKNYFFQICTQRLTKEHRLFVEQLIELSDPKNINKFVIGYLCQSFWKNKTNETDLLLNNILKENVPAANISLGDVMLVLRHIEAENVNEETRLLLFFIKSFYSMRLYEYYDNISEGNVVVYPQEEDRGMTVYKVDAMYEHTNVLQNFLNGAYFTFDANELMAPKNSIAERDVRCINGKILSEKLRTLKDEIELFKTPDGMSQEEKEKFQMRFRLCEFFILTTTRAVGSRDQNKILTDRDDQLPPYLTKYNINNGYYKFSILAIFYNLANPQYAYKRYESIADIYDFAFQNDWTLLGSMIQASLAERNHKNEKDVKTIMNSLLSCSIIRNIDVLQAMFELLKSRRMAEKETGSTRKLIAQYYQTIQKMGMKTYPTDDKGNAYNINFAPLSALIDYLEREDDKAFEDIFFTISDEKESKLYDFMDVMQKEQRFPVLGNTILKNLRQKHPNTYKLMQKKQWKLYIKDTTYNEWEDVKKKLYEALNSLNGEEQSQSEYTATEGVIEKENAEIEDVKEKPEE